ncbi:adhesion G-protein coupled receptor G2-like [Ctenopharyngodon idella]|uniref:adhesion G-protein coupled receptor G2-like n=1 Tax=Ctenopharyngodon idella TaxID=7959 RepID=UPI00222F13D0|nr:adhesion G-protein coupled receptor G2-like [Ctenopharyngodon idella]
MTLLLLLIMIYGLDGGECGGCEGSGILRLTSTTKGFDIEISLESGPFITVNDTAEQLSCNSKTNSCYIECSYEDFFVNKASNEIKELQLCVQKQNTNKTAFEFSIVNYTSLCIVVYCLPDEIKGLLETKENQMNSPKGLRSILNIKKMCQEVILNEAVVDTYIRVEKSAIESVINMTEQSKNYTHEDLSMIVVMMNLSTADDYVPISAPRVLGVNEVAETLIPVKSFQNGSKIGVVTYDSDQHFKLKLGSKIVTSKIIRIEVPEHDFVKLTNRLKIQFKVNHSYTNHTSNYTLSCQFYDANERKKVDKWKSDGCLTVNTSDDVVECSCDHMTPFAVLLTNLEISEQQWEILSSISYVGCGLSAFFSACSVLGFMFNRNSRAEVSNSIHVSLSGALFLLNISFMLSEWAATLTEKNFCVFIAVMIHYSLLSCFTWMAVEALHLYLLLIRVFNINIKHYIIKLSLIGWGVPAVVVGGLLSVYNIHPFYGLYEMTLSDTNKTNPVCLFIDPLVMYGVNISYFTVIFLLNVGILITVSRQIFKLRHVGNKPGKIPVWKDTGTVLGLMCLLGTTWGLIFFSMGYTNYPILYLFCILNTMQGFCIFLWMCGTARKNRAQASQSKTKSTVDVSK